MPYTADSTHHRTLLTNAQTRTNAKASGMLMRIIRTALVLCKQATLRALPRISGKLRIGIAAYRCSLYPRQTSCVITLVACTTKPYGHPLQLALRYPLGSARKYTKGLHVVFESPYPQHIGPIMLMWTTSGRKVNGEAQQRSTRTRMTPRPIGVVHACSS